MSTSDMSQNWLFTRSDFSAQLSCWWIWHGCISALKRPFGLVFTSWASLWVINQLKTTYHKELAS